MPLLGQKEREFIEREFKGLVNPVTLVMFTQEIECEHCADTRRLVEEIAGLSQKITARIHHFVLDKAQAESLGIDKIPAVALLSKENGEERDHGIRYYGIPAGYEFSTLLAGIVMVSRGESALSRESKTALAGLRMPVHLQVFVTPT